MKNLKYFLLIILLLTGCGVQESVKPKEEPKEQKIANLPVQQNIDVPFTSQAPEKNWYEPWLNACEETSILMVDSFYTDDRDIDINEAKVEIHEIIKIKRSNIDYSKDESLETIIELINELDLDWTAYIKENPTIDELRLEIANNNPIIVPVYARELDNPYYTGEGPDYHVMVLTGYDENRNMFIVNDPGTQYGEGLTFTYEVLMDSIHDLNKLDYDAGKKQVLFTKFL